MLTLSSQYGSKPKVPSKLPAPSESGSSTASYEGSPVQMGNYYHAHSGTQHHSLRPHDGNPYFSHGSIFQAIGASPAESPLGQTPPSVPGDMVGRGTQLRHGAGDFGSLAGTSPTDHYYQHSQDRFPFYGPEAYAPAAIRG